MVNLIPYVSLRETRRTFLDMAFEIMAPHWNLGAVVGFILATTVSGMPFITGNGDLVHADVRQLTQVTMHRRDVGDEMFELPQTMQFIIKIGRNEVTVNLNKHETMSTDVHVADEFGQLENSLTNYVGIYQDLASMSSMLVECNPRASACNLLGSVSFGGQKWRLFPDNANPLNHVARRETVADEANLEQELGRVQEVANDRQRRDVESVYDGYVPLGETDTSVIPDCYIVEILALCDESVWDFFLEWAGYDEEEAEKKLWKYYLLLYTEIDLRFRWFANKYPGGCKCIRVYLAGIYVIKKWIHSWSAGAEFQYNGTTVIDADQALFKCGKIQKKRRTIEGTPNFDVGECWTRKNMMWDEQGDGNHHDQIDVLAYVGTACNDDVLKSQASLVQANGKAVDLLGAYGIANNLGARSDGEAGCSDADGFIMARRNASYGYYNTYMGGGNSWKFSKCSHRDICDYIENLPENCLLDHGFSRKNFWKKLDKALPGKRYTLEQQCEIRFGHDSHPCEDSYGYDICSHGIGCSTPYGDCKKTSVLSGTTCGDDRICYKGKCIDDTGEAENEFEEEGLYEFEEEEHEEEEEEEEGNGPCGSCNSDGDCQNPLMCRPLHSNYSANGCQCLPPYYYDTCGACVKDEDECHSSYGGCEQICVNTIGSYHCDCYHGYDLNEDGVTCDDEDECEENNGLCEHICVNTPGSYDCECNEDYELGPNGYCCDHVDDAENEGEENEGEDI